MFAILMASIPIILRVSQTDIDRSQFPGMVTNHRFTKSPLLCKFGERVPVTLHPLLHALICLNLDSVFYQHNLMYLRTLIMAPFRADIKFHLMCFHFFQP